MLILGKSKFAKKAPFPCLRLSCLKKSISYPSSSTCLTSRAFCNQKYPVVDGHDTHNRNDPSSAETVFLIKTESHTSLTGPVIMRKGWFTISRIPSGLGFLGFELGVCTTQILTNTIMNNSAPNAISATIHQLSSKKVDNVVFRFDRKSKHD